MAGARTWILDQLDAERSRWMLWLPVAMGLGIAVYFELPSEPVLWLGPLLAAGGLVLAFLAPSGSLARALAIGLLAAAVGLGLVAWRTASLAAPTLSRPLFSINVEGRIADIQRLPESVRVVLEAVRLKGNGVPPTEMTPVRVRVSLSKGAPPIHVGDRLLVLANLSPPAGPAAPGAFDFQRVAWYQQLGAVGYALAPATVIEHGRPDGLVRTIDALRADITARILAALPGPAGGVAAALLTREQTAVDAGGHQARRGGARGRDADRRAHRVGQPRRAPLGGPRPVRPDARDHPAPGVLARAPRLSRRVRRAPAGGARRAAGAARPAGHPPRRRRRALPRVGVPRPGAAGRGLDRLDPGPGEVQAPPEEDTRCSRSSGPSTGCRCRTRPGSHRS